MSKKLDKLFAEKQALDAKAKCKIKDALAAQDSGDFDGFMRAMGQVAPLIEQAHKNTLDAFAAMGDELASKKKKRKT